MPTAWLLASAVIGYLLGSLPFGYLVARAHGVDIFKVGSGNPGATNVKRTLGARAGNTVLVLDVVKGALAAAWPLVPLLNAPDPRLAGVVGVIAAVLGHSFSVFTRFRGGKGVATALGIALALSWKAGLAMVLIWIVVAAVTRYSSLAAMIAMVAGPALFGVFGTHMQNEFAIAMCVIVLFKHMPNLKRLLRGEEPRIGESKANADGS